MNFTFSHPNVGSYDFSLIDEDSILDSFQTGPDGDVLGSWLREKARDKIWATWNVFHVVGWSFSGLFGGCKIFGVALSSSSCAQR